MPWPQDRLWVNDRSLADFGIELNGLPTGFHDAPSAVDHAVPVPGRMGHRRVSGERESAPRRVTVEGVIRAPAGTAAEAATLWTSAKKWLAQDELELRFTDWPDIVGFGHFVDVQWKNIPGFKYAAGVVLTFEMPNPLKYARQFDVYTIPNGEEKELVLGSAPSDVHLRLVSLGLANPQVLYKDAQGLTRGDVSFALGASTFPTGQWIDYNAGGDMIPTRYISGGGTPAIWGQVVVDVPELLLTRHFVADPDDGDATTGPTLTAVNCEVQAFIWPAYL